MIQLELQISGSVGDCLMSSDSQGIKSELQKRMPGLLQVDLCDVGLCLFYVRKPEYGQLEDRSREPKRSRDPKRH
jgi:hypothetical protein